MNPGRILFTPQKDTLHQLKGYLLLRGLCPFANPLTVSGLYVGVLRRYVAGCFGCTYVVARMWECKLIVILLPFLFCRFHYLAYLCHWLQQSSLRRACGGCAAVAGALRWRPNLRRAVRRHCAAARRAYKGIGAAIWESVYHALCS